MLRTLRHRVRLVFPVLCLSLTVGGLRWPALKITAGEITGKPETTAKRAAKLPIDQAVTIAASDLGLQSFRKSDVTVEESAFAESYNSSNRPLTFTATSSVTLAAEF